MQPLSRIARCMKLIGTQHFHRTLGIMFLKCDRSGRWRRVLSKAFVRLGIRTPVIYFHSLSVYDLEMNCFGKSMGEDLFSLILAKDRVVVDNNLPWKARAKLSREKAFILGRTLSNEASNLQGVFFQ